MTEVNSFPIELFNNDVTYEKMLGYYVYTSIVIYSLTGPMQHIQNIIANIYVQFRDADFPRAVLFFTASVSLILYIFSVYI